MSSRPREEIPPEADEVLPYLYVGNLVFARNPSLVAKLGITHILNLTRHSVPKELFEQCHYTAIVLKDKSGQDIISHFGTAFEVIESAKRAHGKIFVHCKAGVSRSVTITVAYLMHAYKWTLRESWYHVRKARSVIHPNRGFLHQLVQYEKILFPPVKGAPHMPSLNLHEEIHFTVFERMEELYGSPLMDFCKANPQCQHEIEDLAAKAFLSHHSKPNTSFCYDAGIAGKMHLHRVQLYTRADLPWLDVCIQAYLAQLQARQALQPPAAPPSQEQEKTHKHHHHHHHHHHHSSHHAHRPQDATASATPVQPQQQSHEQQAHSSSSHRHHRHHRESSSSGAATTSAPTTLQESSSVSQQQQQLLDQQLQLQYLQLQQASQQQTGQQVSQPSQPQGQAGREHHHRASTHHHHSHSSQEVQKQQVQPPNSALQQQQGQGHQQQQPPFQVPSSESSVRSR